MATEWVECTKNNGMKAWINLVNVTHIELGGDGVAMIRFTDGAQIRVTDAPQDILSRASATVAHEK